MRLKNYLTTLVYSLIFILHSVYPACAHGPTGEDILVLSFAVFTPFITVFLTIYLIKKKLKFVYRFLTILISVAILAAPELILARWSEGRWFGLLKGIALLFSYGLYEFLTTKQKMEAWPKLKIGSCILSAYLVFSGFVEINAEIRRQGDREENRIRKIELKAALDPSNKDTIQIHRELATRYRDETSSQEIVFFDYLNKFQNADLPTQERLKALQNLPRFIGTNPDRGDSVVRLLFQTATNEHEMPEIRKDATKRFFGTFIYSYLRSPPYSSRSSEVIMDFMKFVHGVIMTGDNQILDSNDKGGLASNAHYTLKHFEKFSSDGIGHLDQLKEGDLEQIKTLLADMKNTMPVIDGRRNENYVKAY